MKNLDGVTTASNFFMLRFKEICILSRTIRQKMKFQWLRPKLMNTKLSHGPIHFKSYAKII
ncbi:hypothetical protein GIB67_015444 [Kingdonia uniflora]|uniref:Uncharacterized protein n=1 Tax=Kingdonia uniflora TaxID=39325 RepID=A0A7J7KYY7_9MAGN|nr:hypothetical protein GIB67_015444 [Kingdonia uniflora]